MLKGQDDSMKEMTVAHQLNDTNGEQAWNQSTIVSSGHIIKD